MTVPNRIKVCHCDNASQWSKHFKEASNTEDMRTLILFFCLMMETRANDTALRQENSLKKELHLAYLMPWTNSWDVGPLIGSAIILGIETVFKRGLLPGYDISWSWVDSKCEPLPGVKAVVTMFIENRKLDGIIGAGCSVVCEPVSLLATAKNTPMVSYACASELLSDKNTHKTFTRVSGSVEHYPPIYSAIPVVFGWSRIAIMATSVEVSQSAAKRSMAIMQSKGMSVLFYTMRQVVLDSNIDQDALLDIEKILNIIRKRTSFIFILANDDDKAIILAKAKQMNMLTPEYAYMTSESKLRSTSSLSGQDVFQGVISLQASAPDSQEWKAFMERVKTSFADPHFDNVSRATTTELSDGTAVYAGNLYIASFSCDYDSFCAIFMLYTRYSSTSHKIQIVYMYRCGGKT